MARYSSIKKSLLFNSKTWLITGVAGFIGYNLASYLLIKNYTIYGIDNFDDYYSVLLKKKD